MWPRGGSLKGPESRLPRDGRGIAEETRPTPEKRRRGRGAWQRGSGHGEPAPGEQGDGGWRAGGKRKDRRRGGTGGPGRPLLALLVGGALAVRCSAPVAVGPELDLEEIRRLRDEAREMFTHGYDSYLRHAGLTDELRPLSCTGRSHLRRERGTLDDSLGGYRLTLVDSLDALALQRNFTAFGTALDEVRRTVRFDQDVHVSVFEANIRVLGGLLAAHQLAARFRHLLPGAVYDGFLLAKAQDLGERLLPAFDTPTGLPYHRINLKTGRIAPREKKQTCTAAAGSLLVELGLLSRLTGDPRFETAAQRAVDALWERRSSIQLVGSLIDISTGKWTGSHTGAGAGVDSFHEYLYKASVLLKKDSLGVAFNESYAAVQRHCSWKPSASMRRNFRRASQENATSDAWYMQLAPGDTTEFLIEVDMHKGYRQPHGNTVSALQAFWPGLQVLAGHVLDAERSYAHLLSLWGRYRALPDLFDLVARDGAGGLMRYGRDSPLRPELIESTYHLYEATRKPAYLGAAKEMLYTLQNDSRVDCGFASIADVTTRRLDDRMDSFVLSETFKYLFLIFDGALPADEQSSLLCPADADMDRNRGASGDANGRRGAAVVPGPAAWRGTLPLAGKRGKERVAGAVGPWGTIEEVPPAARRDCLRRDEFVFSTEGHILLIPE